MCKGSCKLCNNVVISNSVTFNGTSLVINIPAGSYLNNHLYCLVVAQSIPSTTTINAPVVVTIGSGTVQYPLVGCDCSQVSACKIAPRTKYKTRLETSVTSGVFRVQGNLCCINRKLASVNGTAPVTSTSTTSDE